MNQDARRPQKKAGRPVAPATGSEPGLSYVRALALWPDEVAGMSRTKLAELSGVTQSVLSEYLGKAEAKWEPTQKVLEQALKIIEVCGGSLDDLDAWRRYHVQVVEYQAAGCSKPDARMPLPPSAGAGSPAGEAAGRANDDDLALDHLRRLSDSALADAAMAIAPGPLHPRGVGLDRLYVPRRIEHELLSRLAEPSAHIVVGEPGYGKTSLMWSLHRRLENSAWQPFFIRATALSGGLAAAADDEQTQVLRLDMLDAALRSCLARNITPVLLVDTVDLLMHSPQTRVLVSELLGLAYRRSVRLVATSRPGEAELLAPSEEEAAELRMIRLGRYDDAERAAAVTRYAEAFYWFGGQSIATSDFREVQRSVLNAVYHDLPLREVCDNPLTLRLLFELYAPHMPDEQVDVASLYDRFWELRVLRDARAGQGSDPAASAADGSGSPHRDLQEAARTLARLMLGLGAPELAFEEAVRGLVRLSDGESDLQAAERSVDLLAARGVLAISPGSTTVRFFHQTFFEYAAARFICTTGRADALIDRICADPGDLLLAAVAAQALPRLPVSAEPDRLLDHLVDADEQNAVTLGLSVYAHLPMGRTNAVSRARHALATASADSVRRFLLMLPGIRHESPERWLGDLRIVWERWGETDEDLRVHLIESLARLAGRSPADALEFLDEYGCMDWIRGKEMRVIRGHHSLYLRAIAPVYATDPVWARAELIKFWDLFVSRRVARGAADILETVLERIGMMPDAGQVGELDTVLNSFGPLLALLVDTIGLDTATPVIRAYGRLWAQSRRCAGMDDLAGLLASVAGRLPEPDVSARAQLYGVGHLARTATVGQVQALLAGVGRAKAPGWQTAMLDGVLIPLLAEDGGEETEATREAAAVCRAALSELPAPEKEADGSRTRPALYREAVWRARNSDDRLLALLPEPAPDGGWEVWLRPDGLMRLVGAAAAAGHSQAVGALHAFCTDPAWREGRFPVRFSVIHTAIITPCHQEAARQPRMVRYLINDGLLAKNPIALVAGIDRAGEASEPIVAEYREQLTGLLAELVGSGSGESRRLGYRLWRALVTWAHWPPPEPMDLLRPLESKPGTPLHVSALELCLAAVDSNQWSAAQAAAVIPALCAIEDAGRAARATAGSRSKAEPSEGRLIDAGDDARHVRVTIACRTGDLATPVCRLETVETALDLALNGGYDITDETETGRLTKAIRQLGWLAARLLDVDPDSAAALLLRAGTALHAIDPDVTRPQREIANRWRTPVGLVLTGSGPGGRKRFICGLVHSDVSLARVAIEVFAQQYASPPPWFRALTKEPGLHPKIMEALRGNLFFHNRSHGGEPWRALLT